MWQRGEKVEDLRAEVHLPRVLDPIRLDLWMTSAHLDESENGRSRSFKHQIQGGCGIQHRVTSKCRLHCKLDSRDRQKGKIHERGLH